MRTGSQLRTPGSVAVWGRCCQLVVSGTGAFAGQRGAYELSTSRVTGSQGMEVPTCLCEAQQTVRSASNPVGIVVVLPVVLPEAHGTDLEVATLIKRQETTAGTAVRAVLGLAMDV